MARGFVVALVLSAFLAGCAQPGGDFVFSGPLDRALTDAEAAEVRKVTGRDFDVESTDIGCPPEVDPYDCNQHSLRVDGVSERACRSFVDRLEGRAYWRGAPTCWEPGS